MKAVTVAAILLAVYLAVDSAVVKEDEETIREIQQLVKECRPYFTEIGKRFVTNVLENAVFEDRIVNAGRALHNCLHSEKTDPCRRNEQVAKAIAIVAELYDKKPKKGFHVEVNTEKTEKLVIVPYEAFDAQMKPDPHNCACRITDFVKKHMHAG